MEKFAPIHILATAKLCDVEQELLPAHAVELGSSTVEERGKMPIIPALENQKDLTKLVAILLSTGINRNDDVFLPSEVLPVRNTGAHKPVNLEHDPTQIIGHMIRTFATEKTGARIPDGKKPKGKKFNITAEAVIYKFLFPDLVSSIKNRADSNTLFVSVEVWFTAFDFLVGSNIIKRTPETSSRLESSLKASGGSGSFEGKRLGRVLRNLIIGGIGVVKDPANPESIIKSVSGFDSEVVSNIEDEVISHNILSSLNELDNSETTELIEINQVETEDTMNPEIIEEMAAMAAAIKAKAEDVTQETEISLEIDDNQEFQVLASRLETLEKSNKELKSRADDAEYKAEASRREAELSKAGFKGQQLDRVLTRCFNMSQNDFNEYISLLVDSVNSILQTKASVATIDQTETATVETTEGGDIAGTQIETSVETAEVETVVETEVAEVEVTEPADTVELEDEIEVQIEPVDIDINTEGDQTEETNLADKMGNIVQKFLQHHNEKWKKLAIK